VHVDWDLAKGSVFLNYIYPALPSAKFQLLCVRMLGLVVVHGKNCAHILCAIAVSVQLTVIMPSVVDVDSVV